MTDEDQVGSTLYRGFNYTAASGAESSHKTGHGIPIQLMGTGLENGSGISTSEQATQSLAQRNSQFWQQEMQRRNNVALDVEFFRTIRHLTGSNSDSINAAAQDQPLTVAQVASATVVAEPVPVKAQDLITYEQFSQIFDKANDVVLRQVFEELDANMVKYGITDRVKLAHFLAQDGEETGGFAKSGGVMRAVGHNQGAFILRTHNTRARSIPIV